jgi:hypothetical protein
LECPIDGECPVRSPELIRAEAGAVDWGGGIAGDLLFGIAVESPVADKFA